MIPSICPDCRSTLSREVEYFRCDLCGREFHLDDGIPLLLPYAMSEFKERESDYHEAVSEQFGEMHQLDSERVAAFKEEYLLHLIRLPSGSTVLELGCGTGWDAVRLVARGIDVYLSDLSAAMVKRARERLRRDGSRKGLVPVGRALYFVHDAEAVPFPDGSFDAVFITAALHHAPSPEVCVAEMARVCKAGGLIILGFEPNRWPYYTFFPIRRLVSIVIKGTGSFIRSPAGALRKLRELRLARGVLLEKKGEGAEPYSPGDRETSGFSLKEMRELIRGAGLEPLSISPVWYINGLIQECSILKGLRSPSQRVESALVASDRLLARVPLLRRLNWHWNAIALKPHPNIHHSRFTD